jgi:2-aminoadipate transaminase
MKIYANRMSTIPKSFIREILKATQDPKVISFAGGLPNPRFFPVNEIGEAAAKVLRQAGKASLQYSTTEGYLPLRQYVAERYSTKGLSVHPDEILITNGSQQGLDLVGKVFIEKHDRIAIEQPGYLGAIQAFSVYEPKFCPVPLLEDGIDIDILRKTLQKQPVKLFHTVINFQNPSGITYSRQKRIKLAKLLAGHGTILIEDDPYGQLRFEGNDLPSVAGMLGDRAVLLGSFSKTVAPGLRLGWVCAKSDVMDKIIVVKQASDLHSNYLSQRILHQYLIDNDVDTHIAQIRRSYKRQRDLMVSLIEEQFPNGTHLTRPEGGMFLWVTLPEGISSLKLFELAIEEHVAFVPGKPFYVDGGGDNTLRLNFSNSDEDRIDQGIRRLARIVKRELAKSK